jgi:Peptidase family M1 domain
MQRHARSFCLGIVVCLGAVLSTSAQNPSGPNSDPIYQQLRNVSLGGEAVTVNNLEIKRDAASFHLHSGTICFLAPVQGRVTGAIFEGDGNLVIDPPLKTEAGSLRLLTREDEFSEMFNHMLLRFTDATYEEIKKAGTAAPASCSPGPLADSNNALRKHLRYNLTSRILQDVLSGGPGGVFVAFVHGKRYNDKEVFAIDPHGAPSLIFPVNPEEVELITFDENKIGIWGAFHLAAEYKNGAATGSQKNAFIHIDHQQLDTTIEKNGNLIGKSITTFSSNADGLHVVPFDLFPSLRVQSVTGENNQPLSFIQEDKKEDADFAVVLPKALAAGEKYTITTSYSGKEAVINEGNGNYFPIAREDWYPNNANSSLGEFTAYDMTFHIPKGMKITATGSLVNESNDGGQNMTVWKSEVPQTVAGFNFGRFKMQEAKLDKPEYLVQSYANDEPPDAIKGLLSAVQGDLPSMQARGEGVALGNMNTTPLIKKALGEGELAIQLYSDYFGPPPFKRLAMTQQTACTFGQSWPALVWLPMCSFYDTTVRHGLGLDDDRGYWKIVAPHEVAHQWWGHQVGFSSYRDQWMSEGFADMSASLFVQVIEKDPRKFIDFWNDERQLLTERNAQGFRAIDAGPVTMGYRMSNSRTGGGLTRRLIYPKGAFILHMVRMMMWGRTTGDQIFKETMQDFVKTYSGKAATTEDFKAMVEKHMTQEMDLDGNHRMDWFFNEYVYGTALPSYNLDYSFDTSASGDIVLAFKATQANVDPHFRMIVPIYLELADNRTVMLGRVRLIGNTTVEQKVPMKGLKDKPHRAVINYNDDVLASAN